MRAKQQEFLKRNNRALAVWGRNNNNDLGSNHTFCFFLFESPTHTHCISNIHQRPASSPILQTGRKFRCMTRAALLRSGALNRTSPPRQLPSFLESEPKPQTATEATPTQPLVLPWEGERTPGTGSGGAFGTRRLRSRSPICSLWAFTISGQFPQSLSLSLG